LTSLNEVDVLVTKQMEEAPTFAQETVKKNTLNVPYSE